jgi:hypothetical protein
MSLRSAFAHRQNRRLARGSRCAYNPTFRCVLSYDPTVRREIAGESSGLKLDKVKALGAKVTSEEFEKLVKS